MFAYSLDSQHSSLAHSIDTRKFVTMLVASCCDASRNSIRNHEGRKSTSLSSRHDMDSQSQHSSTSIYVATTRSL